MYLINIYEQIPQVKFHQYVYYKHVYVQSYKTGLGI